MYPSEKYEQPHPDVCRCNARVTPASFVHQSTFFPRAQITMGVSVEQLDSRMAALEGEIDTLHSTCAHPLE